MKIAKFCIVSIAVFLFSATVSFAQNYQEVVYLKNGSVIKGLITEQIPNESVTIETSDGSLIICKMEDVLKITKEFPVKDNSSKTVDKSGYAWNIAPRYRGFVGESLVVGTGDFEMHRYNLFTSHGCQIIPYIYAGLGIGVNLWSDYDVIDTVSDPDWVSVPIFAHFLTEIHRLYNKRVSPFFDMKIGYSAGDIEGFYFAPSIGCHVYFGKSKTGLSASIGYDLQRADVDYVGYRVVTSMKESLGGVSFSVAFDF